MEDFAALLRSQPFVALLVALAVVFVVAGMLHACICGSKHCDAVRCVSIRAGLLLRSLRGSKGDTVLLLGASGSGKTTFFYQVRINRLMLSAETAQTGRI